MSDNARFAFKFVPAPSDLQGYLNSLYILSVEHGELDEFLPAYSGQLLIARKGGGRMDFGRGFVEAPPHAFLTGPLSRACRFAIDGPALVLGASFTFIGSAAFTQLPAVEFADRFLTVDEALGPTAAKDAMGLAADTGESEAVIGAALGQLVEILRTCLKPLPKSHHKLIEQTYAWLSSSLNPETEELYASLPMSERQVQRLVKRFFGLPSSRLKRRYRAIRVATLLADPDLDPTVREEALNAFYDQAHMIREIREFTGRTPHILRRGKATMGAATLGVDGYGFVNVFGSEESMQLGAAKN